MTLNKGDYLVKSQRLISDHEKIRKDLIYQITRVNRKSYTLKCIRGYMSGTECKLVKDFCMIRVDGYGVETRWLAVTKGAVKTWLQKTS